MAMTLRDGVTLTVQVAIASAYSSTCGLWDTAVWDSVATPWGFDDNWTDVSDDVIKVSTSRSFSRDLRTWSAGKMTIELLNDSGAYSPDNLAGPYAPGGVTTIRPGSSIRIFMTYLGINYHIFYGHVTSWSESWVSFGPRTGSASMLIDASDPWRRLARTRGEDPGVSVGAGETLGPRVSRILNSAGYTGSLSTDVGTIPLQATALSDDPLTELGIVASSEGGQIWIDSDGTFMARRRYALLEDTRSNTVQAVFGDGGAIGDETIYCDVCDDDNAEYEIPWETISYAAIDDTMIINSATYKAVGGVEQTYSDPISIALYGKCDDSGSNTTNLVCQNDSDVLALAQWRVLINRSPEQRVTQITIKPWCDPTVVVPTVLYLRIMDLVRIVRRPPSDQCHILDRNCYVSGIAHEITGGDWKVTYQFASATTNTQYAQSLWSPDSGTQYGLWGASIDDPEAALWFV